MAAPNSTLDPQIDHLYQQPLDAFTSARNALAKTLSGADAARVRTLVKPTVVPWAVNQVFWHARGVLDRLRKSGERVRTAQIAALKGRTSDLRGATDAHRQAIADAVAQAVRLAGAAGSHPGADELSRTLEALSLAPEWPEAPGRLTRPLQPAGFEALAGIPVAAPPATPESRTSAPRAAHTKQNDPPRQGPAGGQETERAERADENEAARLRAEAAQEARERAEAAALADLHRAAAAEAQARAAWEHAKRELEAAARALAHTAGPAVTQTRSRSS